MAKAKPVEKKASVPKNKKERFRSVASSRVQRVLNDMDNLIRCSNTRNYEYTEEEAKKLLKAVYDKYTALKIAFTSNPGSNKKFKF